MYQLRCGGCVDGPWFVPPARRHPRQPSGQAAEEGRARGDERRAAMGDQLYVSVCQSENNICNILAPPLLTQEIRFRRVNLRIIWRLQFPGHETLIEIHLKTQLRSTVGLEFAACYMAMAGFLLDTFSSPLFLYSSLSFLKSWYPLV